MLDALRRVDTLLEKRPFVFVGAYEESLLDSLLPRATWVHRAIIALLFVGILVGMGRARFYLPDNPVPIVLTTFGILATGGILGMRWGLASVLIWYFLGMAGVAVFQGGGNGWEYVSNGFTAGYLIGFILSAWVVGYLSQHGWSRARSLWPMLVGGLLLYLPALLYLHYKDLGWPADGELFSAAMYPFIPGDVIKLLGAALVVSGLWVIADRRRRRQQ